MNKNIPASFRGREYVILGLSSASKTSLAPSGDRFTLAFFNRSLKVTLALYIWKNPSFGDLTLKTTQR